MQSRFTKCACTSKQLLLFSVSLMLMHLSMSSPRGGGGGGRATHGNLTVTHVPRVGILTIIFCPGVGILIFFLENVQIPHPLPSPPPPPPLGLDIDRCITVCVRLENYAQFQLYYSLGRGVLPHNTIQVCATQGDHDFGTPNIVWGIHLRDVS